MLTSTKSYIISFQAKHIGQSLLNKVQTKLPGSTVTDCGDGTFNFTYEKELPEKEAWHMVEVFYTLHLFCPSDYSINLVEKQ
jgi:hypothetical protein